MLYDKNGCNQLQLYEKCHKCGNTCKWDGNETRYCDHFRYECQVRSCGHGSWYKGKSLG